MALPPKLPAADDATRELIATIWQRNLPQTIERLHLLDRAANAEIDTGTRALRAQAADTAHKLAGSLGMFGFEEGTRLARELEQHLESPTPDPAILIQLATRLRESLIPSQ